MENDMKGLGRLWKQPKPQKKYTDDEVMKIIDTVSFPKGLTILQTMKIVYWALFEKRKIYKFCESIQKGKSAHFALKDVSK